MTSVRIPTPLRRLTGDKDEVTINAKNIRELIEGLEKQFPGVKERLCDESGNVRRFINLYVNNEDIRFLNGIETELKEGDTVSIIPAIAGGNAALFHGEFIEVKTSSSTSTEARHKCSFKTFSSKTNRKNARNINKIE